MERYARVLRAPGALGMVLAEIPARLPIGLSGLAIVLFVRQHAGSYAAAGAVAAAYGAALGLASPMLGRLIDRRGLPRVVIPAAILHAAAMTGLVALGLAEAPVWALAAVATVGGAAMPPVGSVARSLWPMILRHDDPGLLPTALAIESVLVELVFVIGPLLAAGLAVAADPAVPVLLSPAMLLVGLAAFLTRPPVRAWRVSEHARRQGALGALRSPGIRTLLVCTFPMGFCFGSMEVTLPAFSEAHGARAAAGVLLAIWSSGSALGGLLYGARAWVSAPGERFTRFALIVPLGYLPLAAAPSIPVMAPMVLLAGLFIAPTLASGNQLAGDVAPRGTETEAVTWPITALVGGIAIGNVVAGALISESGWRTAMLVAASGVVLTAALAWLRRGTLRAPGSSA